MLLRFIRYSKSLNRNTAIRVRTIFTSLSEDELCKPRIQCRNRPFLPGGTSPLLPEYLSQETNKYFHGIKLQDYTSIAANSLEHVGRELKDYLDKHIHKYSAFLIKGLPITEASDFEHLVNGLEFRPVFYDAGMAHRGQVGEILYTASDEPREVEIEPHNEMAYRKEFCSKILFCCLSAADIGGDSPVVFNRDLTRGLTKSLVDKVKKLKIRYIRNLNHKKNTDYFTWQEVFKVNTEQDAEGKMVREEMGWTWQENGNLKVWNTGEATINHPVTGEEIWFNQLVQNHFTYYTAMPWHQHDEDKDPYKYNLHTTYGNGEEFEDEVIEEIRAVTWNNAMSLKLFPGDVLVLDNHLCQHSRMSFNGGERKMIVSLLW